MFDGCDPTTGDLLEAKADIDFMFDDHDLLKSWVYDESNPEYQMVNKRGRRSPMAAASSGTPKPRRATGA